jgi:endonuclease I
MSPNVNSHSSAPQSPHNRTKIGRDYFDEVADAKDREAYYRPVADTFQKSDGAELFQSLHKLLSSTHKPPGELPGDALYSVIDRRPDGALYYLYSGQGPKNEEQATERNSRDLEAYNLEHVVPKSWFDAQLPMRDDLHHLFTEQRKCNSDRGNLPFREVSGSTTELPLCGTVQNTHGKSFEPNAGKGEVARAILYFVTRHPGYVGDRSDEMTIADVPKLLQWHKEYPVSDYERHRNETIEDHQGNRNPFIDFPELAERVDFRAGFGS